jgi:4-amino-4-deoxy-L-arabinose transferase-like glycosyltransferase
MSVRTSERSWDGVAVNAVIAGAAARIMWTFVVHPPSEFVYSDMRGYVTRAERLASGEPLGPVDAFFPPGTHALLAVPIKVFGDGTAGLWAAAVLWCALSISTVWMAWRMARELLTPAAAAITAVLCAASPLFISFGGYFTSETPSLAFLVAAVWSGVMARRRAGRAAIAAALLTGTLGGIALTIRPQLIVNVVLLAIVMVLGGRTARLRSMASYGAGVVAIVALAIALNSSATGRLTGLSTNGGMNFWFGHCNARQVQTVDAHGDQTGRWTHAVPNLAGRGQDFVFENVDTWDEDFFYDLGWKCIEDDGLAHVRRLARNVVDMTATTMPWPQADDTGWQRELPRAFNFAYSLLLPWVVIESLILAVRRWRAGRSYGEAFMLANLLCVVLLALVVVGDPRVRTVYDVFGFALIGALLADRFRLDTPPTDDSLAAIVPRRRRFSALSREQ